MIFISPGDRKGRVIFGNVVAAICICILMMHSGCSGWHAVSDDTMPAAQARTFVFECDDAYAFVVRIEGGKAWLFLPGETVCLPRVSVADGTKYSDGEVTFWSEGQEARLVRDGVPPRRCRNNPAKAVWEHAKLNGADFRAVGNEPGWTLEIMRGDTIVLVLDYGSTRYEFPLPKPDEDRPARRTTYTVAAEGHQLKIVLEGRPWSDTMSGERFETTVTVTLDGKEYRGGGRPLH